MIIRLISSSRSIEIDNERRSIRAHIDARPDPV